MPKLGCWVKPAEKHFDLRRVSRSRIKLCLGADELLKIIQVAAALLEPTHCCERYVRLLGEPMPSRIDKI